MHTTLLLLPPTLTSSPYPNPPHTGSPQYKPPERDAHSPTTATPHPTPHLTQAALNTNHQSAMHTTLLLLPPTLTPSPYPNPPHTGSHQYKPPERDAHSPTTATPHPSPHLTQAALNTNHQSAMHTTLLLLPPTLTPSPYPNPPHTGSPQYKPPERDAHIPTTATPHPTPHLTQAALNTNHQSAMHTTLLLLPPTLTPSPYPNPPHTGSPQYKPPERDAHSPTTATPHPTPHLTQAALNTNHQSAMHTTLLLLPPTLTPSPYPNPPHTGSPQYKPPECHAHSPTTTTRGVQ